MTADGPEDFASRLLALVVRERDREMVIGDLVEERALLAASLPPRDVAKWYRGQIVRSIGAAAWAGFRRGHWLKTLGAAVVGYVAVALMVVAGDVIESKLVSGSETLYAAISLAVGFPAMAVGGYLAACIRPRAASALAVIAAAMALVSWLAGGDGSPAWYQIALIFAGPAGALAGGRMRLRKRNGGQS